MRLSGAVVLLFMVFLALTIPAVAGENSALEVKLRSEQISGRQDLGTLEVAGAGTVMLNAWRQGNKLLLQANGENGKVLGQAEGVIGMRETPIYLATPDGLRKVTVHWTGP